MWYQYLIVLLVMYEKPAGHTTATKKDQNNSCRLLQI
jgi:hypothetical protein